MRLALDIGSLQIKAGLFEGDNLLHAAVFAHPEQLVESLKGRNIERCLISSQDPQKNREMTALLMDYPCQVLEVSDFKKLAADETLALLQPDRIANIFGALSIFPSNDCIIVDIGTTVRFDFVSKQGVYLGGASFPGFDTIFSSLEKTPLPDMTDQSPTALGRSQIEQSKSGCYYGLLGAIERIVAELRLSSEAPSGVMSLVTGAATSSPALQEQVQDFIDHVDPHLTLMGLNQILKEGQL
jgi:type III pantothenate kinase